MKHKLPESRFIKDSARSPLWVRMNKPMVGPVFAGGYGWFLRTYLRLSLVIQMGIIPSAASSMNLEIFRSMLMPSHARMPALQQQKRDQLQTPSAGGLQ